MQGCFLLGGPEKVCHELQTMAESWAHEEEMHEISSFHVSLCSNMRKWGSHPVSPGNKWAQNSELFMDHWGSCAYLLGIQPESSAAPLCSPLLGIPRERVRLGSVAVIQHGAVGRKSPSHLRGSGPHDWSLVHQLSKKQGYLSCVRP